jgi:hypothetical protein
MAPAARQSRSGLPNDGCASNHASSRGEERAKHAAATIRKNHLWHQRHHQADHAERDHHPTLTEVDDAHQTCRLSVSSSKGRSRLTPCLASAASRQELKWSGWRESNPRIQLGSLRDDPDGTKLLAGGHTLLPALKLRLASPELLVDIGGIAELKGIEISETSIRIGALATHAELFASEPLYRELPVFRQAASLIADPQVRNRGTIGGSLANADAAADWPAVAVARR